ncbi:efflux RND transporter periplasmic adaptor subunit [Planctomonas deserti]|uniref:efflux RND transporter periplasmic adaptor subunit n=1 Tax=Planctomonas deserti TaxID=2144185 RepID=UPI000D3A9FD2|nr:biotin/lipoyl-binding protein [Planctomonas deserti]
MGVTRKWIFPILRLIIFGAIAAALVKVAFFGDATATTDPAVPTGEITQAEVAVATGTIVNDIVVEGAIAADATVPIRATLAGTISDLVVAQGATVAKGDPLLRIRQETPVDPVVAEDGSVTQPKPKVRVETVWAPIAGVVGSLPVLKDQVVSVGDSLGSVAPSTFSATGTLTAEQQYRLVTQPADATVTIPGGPAPFSCPGLKVSSGSTTAGEDDPLGGADVGAPPASGGTTVSCAILGEVRVFNGLAASITIAAGEAADVLTLPTTAVEGLSENGNVWVVAPDGGEPEKRPVRIGLNDGASVQIVDGLAEGDTVLQFVPGAPAPAEGEDGFVGYGG